MLIVFAIEGFFIENNLTSKTPTKVLAKLDNNEGKIILVGFVAPFFESKPITDVGTS